MPERLPNINLLPEFRRDSNIQPIIFYLFLALILLSFILIGYFYFTTKSKLEAAQSEVQTLTEQRDTLFAEKTELETDQGSAYEQAVKFAERYAIPTSQLLVELDRLLPDDSYLSGYEYNTSELLVTTHFETLDTVAQYTTNLLNSSYFTDTKVNTIEAFSLKEEDTDDDEENLERVPRYESEFSLSIDKQVLKEGESEDE